MRRMSVWAPLLAVLVATSFGGGAVAQPFAGDAAAYGPGQALPAERAGMDSTSHPTLTRSATAAEARVEKLDRQGASADGGRGDELRVSTARAADGKTIKVAVTLVLPIAEAVVRDVLGDFDNMPRFVPDIRAARSSNTGPRRKRVEIEATAQLLFIEFPINTTLDVTYPTDGAITIDSVAGNLAIHGIVQVQREGPVTRVNYQARMKPDFWLPQLIGDFLISRLIRRQFGGMVAEMHRRAERIANAPD
jgi:hypothetical protein